MSEQILKALMQLFAIISRPESGKPDRHKVINEFLQKLLNQESAQEYLHIFDHYYELYQKKYGDTAKYQKHTSSSSVKLLVICSQINQELNNTQKLALMILLLSFIKSGYGEHSTISEFEQEFVQTVADAFYINNEEFQEILYFVLLPLTFVPDSPNILIINKERENGMLQRDGLANDLGILHVPSSNMYLARYAGDKELYFNSQPMNCDQVYILNYGCSIRNAQIKPIYYNDIVNWFYLDTQVNPLLYEAKEIEYTFDNGKVGLNSIHFEILSGNLVGIMGGSGAGKSTLLSVLTGSNEPSGGQIRINHIDIHGSAKEVEGLIGYVSQDDLLIEELTVFQNLYFSAKLCLGNDSDEAIRRKTDEILQDLGLYEVRGMKVGSPLDKKISGGQRKRLNIAMELIRQPAVLFLDEPTSGLSSRDSDNIMLLLKDLSLKGKLVFVVIHQPSSDIFKMFDRLMVLDQGGYMIYDGNPVDSILYFKSQTFQANRDQSECSECGNVNPEQIFNIVESRVLDEHGNTTNTRRISPKEWYKAFKTVPKIHVADRESYRTLPHGLNKRPSAWKQFAVYVRRNILRKISDRQFVAVCLFEAPLLVLLLSYIVRYYNVSDNKYTLEQNENLPIYIFVSVIVAIFIGLSISAEEIIKDRKIRKRESFLNLSWGGYLFAKILVLFVISAVQAGLFVLIGNGIMQNSDMNFAYWIVLFSAWCCANLMGLIISDTFKSVVTIYILIPFIVIPQLMLSGVLLRFEKINPDISTPASIPWYGELITARWAYEAIAVEQFMNNEYERIYYPYEKQMSIAEFHKNYWLVEMRNKLREVKSDFEQGKQPDQNTLMLLGHEIEKENRKQNLISFSFRDLLAKDGMSDQVLRQTSEYMDRLARYYTLLYNKTAGQKDRKTSEIMNTEPELLNALKSKYFNQSLADMVKSSGETYRLIEYKDQLLQNYHSIYKEPESRFIKAQYYAPEKNVFGKPYPTLWVNICVIWAFNIFLFIALYLRLLPNTFNVFSKRVKY